MTKLLLVAEWYMKKTFLNTKNLKDDTTDNVVVKRTSCGARLLRFYSQLWYNPGSFFFNMCLKISNLKMGTIIVPAFLGCYKI